MKSALAHQSLYFVRKIIILNIFTEMLTQEKIDKVKYNFKIIAMLTHLM